MKKIILAILILSSCGRPGLTAYDLEVFFEGRTKLFQNDTDCNHVVSRELNKIIVTTLDEIYEFEELQPDLVMFDATATSIKLGYDWYLIKFDDRFEFHGNNEICRDPI